MTQTTGAAATDARPLPRPSIRHQPALLRRLFADPQPVLDELAAGHRFRPRSRGAA